jgi:hypothetical protein
MRPSVGSTNRSLSERISHLSKWIDRDNYELQLHSDSHVLEPIIARSAKKAMTSRTGTETKADTISLYPF